MLRTVAGAVGAGHGGGPPDPLTITIRPSHSSSSSTPPPTINLPVSANYSTAPIRPSYTQCCLCHAQTCRHESVDGREDKTAYGSYYNSVLGSVPSRIEVENAVASLQNFMRGISSSGSELDRLPSMLCFYDPRILQSHGYERVYDAFRLLQTEPSVQRMVVSISSDKAVWDAILNNEAVQELQESPYTADEEKARIPYQESDLAACILKWILDITKAKVMELIEKFTTLVNEIFQPPEREKSTAETKDQFEEKLRSSLLLSVVVLLIVVVTRAHSA